MNEKNVKDMRGQNLVNALREHAEWARANEWETPITLGDDLVAAADRLANQNTHIAALQKEIERSKLEIEAGCVKAIARTYGIDINRLRKLAEADKDGWLVMPPCKVGDTVWAASGKIIKCEIDEMYLCDSGGIEFLVSFNCDGADCKRCPFNNWTQDCSGECYCDCEYGNGSFKDSDIGKTIFLTSEEAEKALEAMKDGN